MKYAWIGFKVVWILMFVLAIMIPTWIYAGEYEAKYQYIKENKESAYYYNDTY